MDILSIIGIVLALVAIIGGAILKGSSAGALVGSAAFVIVVVGTLAASLVQTPMATFLRAWKIASWVFKPPANNPAGMIEKIVEWSNVARKQGLLGLESAVEGEQDDFLKKGLQSLVDGGELIRRHLVLAMGRGGEARADGVVELRPGDLAVLVGVEFGHQPVCHAAAVQQPLHRPIGRGRPVHMREGQRRAPKHDGSAKQKGDLGVPGHIGWSPNGSGAIERPRRRGTMAMLSLTNPAPLAEDAAWTCTGDSLRCVS